MSSFLFFHKQTLNRINLFLLENGKYCLGPSGMGVSYSLNQLKEYGWEMMEEAPQYEDIVI